MHRCVLGVLCPVRRPVAALDCIMLKYSNLVLAIGLGVRISFRASEELVSWLSFESTAFWIWGRSTDYHTAILRNTVWKCVCVSAQQSNCCECFSCRVRLPFACHSGFRCVTLMFQFTGRFETILVTCWQLPHNPSPFSVTGALILPVSCFHHFYVSPVP